MTTVRIKRGGSLRIKIADDVEARLDKLSLAYGMPPSTLAAVALGGWVAQQERALLMTEAIADAVGSKMGDSLADELREQMKLFAPKEQGAASPD